MRAAKPVPRVAFNAALLSLTRDYRAAGIHRYIVELLTALAARDDVAVVAFCTDPGARSELPADVEVRLLPRPAARPAARIAWEQLAWPIRAARAGDLLHGPAYAVPALATVPSVATVHDLSFFRMPDAFPRLQAFYLRAATRLAVRRASALLAVSEFTRRELVELLGVDPGRVHVVPNGVDPAYQPASPAAVARVRARYDLPERFVLSVGTLQPRKNLAVLVEAFAGLVSQGIDVAPLVIAGAPGWGDSDLAARARAAGLTHHIRLVGFIPSEDLPALYSAATVMAYPSRYEGFGLPVVEAMACGTPVVISNAASLPEIAGDAAASVPPDDAAGWAAAISDLLATPSRATELAAAGRERARRYSWSRSARETAAVYRRTVAGADPALEASRDPA